MFRFGLKNHPQEVEEEKNIYKILKEQKKLTGTIVEPSFVCILCFRFYKMLLGFSAITFNHQTQSTTKFGLRFTGFIVLCSIKCKNKKAKHKYLKAKQIRTFD